jgi:hypothetical protein
VRSDHVPPELGKITGDKIERVTRALVSLPIARSKNDIGRQCVDLHVSIPNTIHERIRRGGSDGQSSTATCSTQEYRRIVIGQNRIKGSLAVTIVGIGPFATCGLAMGAKVK